jgi:aryl-alcohol dehydrogenase-like predicted oxidoreductase
MADGFRYVGAWDDGEINGTGIATYTNGDVYEGMFVNGRRQGAGVMRYASGEVLETEWEAGLPTDDSAPAPAAEPDTGEVGPGDGRRGGERRLNLGHLSRFHAMARSGRGAIRRREDVTMRYNRLGRSGLFVSELCLGTMTFGGTDGIWGQIGQLGQDAADEIVKTAVDGGINFIDTANVYASGRSEEILGQSIRNLGLPREELVIATKVHGQMGEGPNARGASRGHILNQAKASLKRLQLDHIDLYQIHGFDPATPIEETLEALDTLVQHGHVRYLGLSNWAAWQVMKAVGIAEMRRLAPVVSLQAYYSLAGRDLEREIVPMLLSEGVGLMVWSPLAGGFLSGKFDREGKTRRVGAWPSISRPSTRTAPMTPST